MDLGGDSDAWTNRHLQAIPHEPHQKIHVIQASEDGWCSAPWVAEIGRLGTPHHVQALAAVQVMGLSKGHPRLTICVNGDALCRQFRGCNLGL